MGWFRGNRRKTGLLNAVAASGVADADAGDVMPAERTDYIGPHMAPSTQGGAWTPYGPEAGHSIGDLLRPNLRKTSGVENLFGWLGFLASEGSGKTPWARSRENEAYNLDSDYREAIENATLQAVEEGRDLTPSEIIAMDAMRERIGVSGTGYAKRVGERSDRVVGQDEHGRPILRQEVMRPIESAVPVPLPGGYEGPVTPITGERGRHTDAVTDRYLLRRARDFNAWLKQNPGVEKAMGAGDRMTPGAERLSAELISDLTGNAYRGTLSPEEEAIVRKAQESAARFHRNVTTRSLGPNYGGLPSFESGGIPFRRK